VSDRRARKTNGADPPSLKLRRDWYQARRAAFSKGVADGEVVWSWHPLLVSSLAEVSIGPTGRVKPFNPRGDGGKKELVTGESAKETVKTIRVRECRVIPVRPW